MNNRVEDNLIVDNSVGSRADNFVLVQEDIVP